ncbi:FAD binding domain-containing protein [Oceanirhabdus sp. W0125-5]|uniref:FAD binding domain-containing protein n=1 Tax=Oceanirhabdus sp. W0125-5 TaxID=2999116 RepID=UPI0022F2E925|nr:xanthine dehydrogenase family protein subunit M [Oceanirhabdus sp. W0125-5]WBW95206.1 xanthine dehydrogenase family protein subunit M [Oceanirhabdus sp. W0125-5]
MLSKFDYVKPQTLSEALNYLEQNASTRILAGGTDLMIILHRNVETPEHILDIKGILETKLLEYKKNEGLFIGASVTVNQVAESKSILEKYPALVQAANSLASYQLRNRATVVGNICNASPGADLAGPLMVYDAKILIASVKGTRIVDINSFFLGVKKTVLKASELVIGVFLPDVSDGDNSTFLKQTRLKGHDLGIVGVTARMTADKKIRLAMSAVSTTPIRLYQLEETLSSQPLTSELAVMAGKEVRNIIKPISDVRSSADYRYHVSEVLVKRALQHLSSMGGE